MQEAKGCIGSTAKFGKAFYICYMVGKQRHQFSLETEILLPAGLNKWRFKDFF